MKNLLLSSLVCIVLFTIVSCDKSKDIPFSTFKVDGVEYKTNNVDTATGKVIAQFGSHDSIRFDFTFFVPYFPTSGEWDFGSNPTKIPSKISFSFYFGLPPSTPYPISPYNTTKMVATEKDGRPSYQMPPTWFHKPGGTDSVLIEGEFNVP